MRQLLKVFRYIKLYGPRRTFFKIAGRLRVNISLYISHYPTPDIVLIGCGQFGVTTLGYFITRRFGRRFRWVFDIDETAAKSASRLLGGPRVAVSSEQAISDPETKFVYIASNHASHTDYAISVLAEGKMVHLEKPISVSRAQFAKLRKASIGKGKLFAGYNRPFSGAIQYLRKQYADIPTGGLSVSCFVSGHVISPDHWYRDLEEGTRICGNAGHWIDLFVHILAWRNLPDYYRLQILQADPSEPDDNFALSIATNEGDIFNLMLSARSEPFEGINETVNIQQDNIIAKIDDFRHLTTWQGAQLTRKRFWPKDVGHKAAALQLFEESPKRNWREVEVSTVLMLRVLDMVRDGKSSSEMSVKEEFKLLDELQNQ